MRTIIAPTNFSAPSLNAVNYAADLAVNTDSSLLLLHVIPIPDAFDVPVTQYEYESMLEKSEEQLDLLKEQLLIRTQCEIDITTKAVFSTMSITLNELYQQTHPFIIVIGPETGNAAERFLISSHTFNAATNLPCPVVVVPENAFFKHVKRIGLATDLKDAENIPVELIGAMVELFGASLDIIHVCASSDEKAACEQSIADIRLRLQDFQPTFHFEMNEDVGKGIAAYAKRNNEDLVIVLPRKHSLFASIFHRSQAKKIALSPVVPVISIHE